MNILAIHRVMEDGEKNVALVLEYPRPVRNAGLDVDAFSVSGRTILKVYANDHAGQATDGLGRDGRYVIVEMDPSDELAVTLPFRWDVKERQRIPYEVGQRKDVAHADGSVCTPWTEHVEIQNGANLEFDQFTPGVYQDPANGTTLAYMLFVPREYNPDRKYPFVLYWHGGGEKGDNNLKSMLCSLNGVIWATEEEQKKHPCFVLVPQCPMDGDWIDPDTYEMTGVFDAVCRLMFSVFEKYSVDRTRLYCTGFSMGGMSSWEASKRYYRMFAASLVFAGQSNPEELEVLKDSNLWVFHGEDDDKAMPGNVDNMETLESVGAIVNRAVWDGSLRGPAATSMAEEQLAKGGSILHSLYREGSIVGGWAHEFGARPAITNEAVRDWLFSHVKSHPSFEPYQYAMPAEYVPVRVGLGFDGSQVRQIAAGNRHNVALLQDGRVFAWGFNVSGQVGNGKSGALSDQETPVQVEGLRDIVQVAAGNNFSLALTADGGVYGWGGNNCCQLGNLDTTKRYAAPVGIGGISAVKELDAGDNYAVALKQDGTVWAWGGNINGQLGNGTFARSHEPVQVKDPDDASGFLSDVAHVEAGVRTVVALKVDGTIRCWGDGEYGQLGKAVANHGPGTTLPFRSLDKSDPTGYLTNVRGAAEGRCFTAVLKNDGTVFSWGLNRHGELGLGDYKPEIDPSDPHANPEFFTTIVHPRRVDGLDGVMKITAGMNHTVALKQDGSVWTWGYNKLMGSGALGAGNLDGSKSPVRALGLTDIREIYTGFNHNFAIGKDGTIWAWGNARNGRLGPLSRA
jgi:predicted peptidase/alpha-tubulin suppressor-like RCC1 family protein